MSPRDRYTIMVVNPNTTRQMTDQAVASARAVARAETNVVGGSPTRGVAAVESNLDEVLGAVAVVEQVESGERAGVDGYVIACFGDTGLGAARELARGPVVGMTEAAIFTAALLAPRFSIVTLPPRTREQSVRVLRASGLEHRASVWAIDVNVIDVAEDASRSFHILAEAGQRALEEDAAEAIVLGCAGLGELADPLAEKLGVPIIDGVPAAVTMVEGLLAQGLSTSRRFTYAAQPELGHLAPLDSRTFTPALRGRGS